MKQQKHCALGKQKSSNFWGTRDIRESCKKSRKDFVLSREAIWDVYITIGAYKRMAKFFRAKYMEYPLLSLWMQDMPNMDRVEQRLKRVFDEKGELLDTASPKLASHGIRLVRREIVLNTIFKPYCMTRIIRNISKKRLLRNATIVM